jgi:glutathione S-transferase
LQGDVRKAPKRKLPFISFPSGEQIADSTLCYRYLKQHKNFPDIDDSLTEKEKAQSVAYKAFLEEWVYFLVIWEKWIDQWYKTREAFFGKVIPLYPMRVLVFTFIYRDLNKMLYSMGIARHSKEDILSFIADAIKAISVLVGDTGLFGGRACSANAYLFGLLVAIIQMPDLCPVFNAEVAKYPNLRRWTESWVERYFPERKL